MNATLLFFFKSVDYCISLSLSFIIFLYGCSHINLYCKTYKIIYIIKLSDILIISNFADFVTLFPELS